MMQFNSFSSRELIYVFFDSAMNCFAIGDIFESFGDKADLGTGEIGF